MITDRMRFIVEQANTGIILNRDLEVIDPKPGAQLSGPSTLQFALSPYANSSSYIDWGKNKQWVHIEMEVDGVRRLVMSTITKSAQLDPESGNMNIECYGFADYPKDKPWLENWNDIAVDPFEIVERVWNHVQSFPNAQLGVSTYPASSGTQMLPGYGFDGTTLVFDSFTLFIRAVDFSDCADQINGLARDIPFDYIEKSWWNETRTVINKQILLGYPAIETIQENLSFVQGENIMKMELADDKDIEPVTDVGIRGWFPGKVYDARLGNTDDNRFREFLLEEDAKINSTERAAAWAKKRLQKRTIPKYWKKIQILANHPNAPFGSWQLGDRIYVQGQNQWYGEIKEWHRIVSWAYDEKAGLIELGLKVEGAFNYDPIDFDENVEEELPPNLIPNGFFGNNLANWVQIRGTWIRVATKGFETPGCVRIDCDDVGEAFRTTRINVYANEQFNISGMVSWEDVTSTPLVDGFAIDVYKFQDGGLIGSPVRVGSYKNPTSTKTWQKIQGLFTVPPSGVNEIAVQLTVDTAVTGGKAWWDDIKMTRAN